MKLYIQLLQKHKLLARLSTIQLISYFGAWFSNVAIYTLLLSINVEPEIVAFVAILHFLAGVIQAPFSGTLIDRFAPKKLMLVLLCIEIIATLFLVTVQTYEDLNFLYILIFLKMAAASFYFTTEISLLPKILDGVALRQANEIHSIIWSFSYTLGMALSGFFVYYFGVFWAFIIDAFMYSIALVILIMTEFPNTGTVVQQHMVRMMVAIWHYFKEQPKALHLMVLHAFVGLTAFDALVALMVEHYYALVVAPSLALGLLHAFRALGLVIGPVILGKWVSKERLLLLFCFQAIAIFIWAMSIQSFYLSLGSSIIVGLFTTTLWSYTYTLLQNNIDPNYYGRVVAYNDMLFLSVSAGVSYMIGFLAQHNVSLQMITYYIGSGFFIGAIYYKWIIATQDIKEIG